MADEGLIRYLTDDQRDRLATLRAEMADWIEGRRSHLNEMMTVENGSENRQQTLVAAVQADAAEVSKLAAAIQAEVASATATAMLAEARAEGAAEASREVHRLNGVLSNVRALADEWEYHDTNRPYAHRLRAALADPEADQ